MSLPTVLTDQGGIARLTTSKVLKDLVADALMGAAAGLIAVNVGSVDAAAAQPTVAIVAIANAVISAVYRAVLRWATS